MGDIVEIKNLKFQNIRDAVVGIPVQSALLIDNDDGETIEITEEVRYSVVSQNLEMIVLCLMWGYMECHKEYTINYTEFLKMINVNGKGCKQEPIGRDIKFMIHCMINDGYFKAVEVTSKYTKVIKLENRKYLDCQKLYFHYNDLLMLLDDNKTYVQKDRLLRLMVLIKFNMIVQGVQDYKQVYFNGYKEKLASGLDTSVKTISRYLDYLAKRNIIYVYPQERKNIQGKYKHTTMLIRDAGSEIAHQANQNLGYSLWSTPIIKIT